MPASCISIVKYIEDKRNVLHDTKAMDVPVILVVEDDIRYYSLFLPVIYTELISQSRRLLSEGVNVAHKLVRMRARPKILLGSNYEDAEREVMKYRDHLLGVVSDVEFPRAGELTPEAGFELARMIRDLVPDVPIVLQSSRTEFMERAHAKDIRISAEALAHAAGRLAADSDRAGWLRRFCLSPAGRQNGSGAGQRSERAGDAAGIRFRRTASPITASATISRTG